MLPITACAVAIGLLLVRAGSNRTPERPHQWNGLLHEAPSCATAGRCAARSSRTRAPPSGPVSAPLLPQNPPPPPAGAAQPGARPPPRPLGGEEHPKRPRQSRGRKTRAVVLHQQEH